MTKRKAPLQMAGQSSTVIVTVESGKRFPGSIEAATTQYIIAIVSDNFTKLHHTSLRIAQKPIFQT
jgi:hypothetical protein